MKKRGFTLMEMLVVLILIAIILLIAIPSVTKIRESQTRKAYDTHVKLMRQALDTYTIKHQSKLKGYQDQLEESQTKCFQIKYEDWRDAPKFEEKGMKCNGYIILKPKSNGTYDYDYTHLTCAKYDEAGNIKIMLSDNGGDSSDPGCFDLTKAEGFENRLKSLSVDKYAITPAFNEDVLEYSVNVESSITSIRVLAEAKDSNATVKITGNTNLKTGSNTVTIKVTPENMEASDKIYKIIVNKPAGTKAELKELGTNVCVLQYIEEEDIYKCRVGNNVTSVSILADPVEDGSTIFLKHGSDTEYDPIGDGTVPLDVGDNGINVMVKSETCNEEYMNQPGNQCDTKEYKIDIVRLPNDNSFLSSLSTDKCNIEFNKNQFNYECTVDNLVKNINVIAQPENDHATVTVSDNDNLIVGDNNIKIKVDSENCKAEYAELLPEDTPCDSKTYTIKVTRTKSSDATLFNLNVTNCILEPEFNKDVTIYKCSGELENSIKQIDISATGTNEEATITGLGVKNLLPKINNRFEINVLAEDGETSRTYEISAYRKPSTNADLSSLSVNGYTLDKEFNKDEVNYSVSVDNTTTSLNLNYELDNEEAIAHVNGNNDFVLGNNTVQIVVTAGDEVTEKIYTINVYRKAKDATLKNLEVLGCELTPAFNNSVTSYSCTPDFAANKVTILGELNDTKGRIVSGLGEKDITFGDNPFEVVVEAEDSNYTNTYTINVIKTKDARNTLENLEVIGYTIKTATNELFDPTKTEYYVEVEDQSIIIKADPTSNVATVVGDGIQTIEWGETKTFAVIVTSQNGEVKTYSITATNSRPTAPVIGGGTGTNSWSNVNKTVEVVTAGTAKSGLNYYEYYVTDEGLIPNAETFAVGRVQTLSDEEEVEEGITVVPQLVISDDGIYDVYYRTVSENGNKSVWSNKQVFQIDKTGPTAPVFSSSSSPSWSSITASYQASTALSGIKEYKCYYGTSSDSLTSSTTSTSSNCNITGLSQNTTYYFKLCAVSKSGIDNCSGVNSQKTKKVNNLVLTKTTAIYDGGVKSAVVVADSGNTPTITYYSNSSCTTKTTTSNAASVGGAPKAVGTYYITASDPGNSEYSAGSLPCSEGVVISFPAPTVTGGSTSWNTSRTFSISSVAPNAARYEYYISNSSTSPSNSQTATGSTTSTSVTISTTGTYIFFRVVDASGTVSDWTSVINLYVDTTDPSYTLTGGTYTYGSSAAANNVYSTPTYGISGGTISCINTSSGNRAVSTYNSVGLGPASVSCVATSGAGKTTTKTASITIEGTLTWNGSDLPCSGTCNKSGTTISLPSGYNSTYGPYVFVNKGNYKVEFTGNNLNIGSVNSTNGYYAYSNCGNTNYTLSNSNISSTKATFSLNVDPAPTSCGAEIRRYNTNTSQTITVSSLKLSYPAYTASMSGSNVSFSASSMAIEKGGTNTVTVTPSSGYYISGGSCTNGYTISGLTTGTSATGAQTITINNNSKASNSTCTISTAARSFTATMSGSNVSFSSSSLSVAYGGTNTVTVTPSGGYYLSSVSCTNGYTTNASTGTSATAAQTVTIRNNSNASNSTCTFTMAPRSYTLTVSKDGNIASTSGAGTYTYGSTVTITATPNGNVGPYWTALGSCSAGQTRYYRTTTYSVSSFSSSPAVSGTRSGNSYTFTMPASNVVITVNGTSSNSDSASQTCTYHAATTSPRSSVDWKFENVTDGTEWSGTLYAPTTTAGGYTAGTVATVGSSGNITLSYDGYSINAVRNGAALTKANTYRLTCTTTGTSKSWSVAKGSKTFNETLTGLGITNAAYYSWD